MRRRLSIARRGLGELRHVRARLHRDHSILPGRVLRLFLLAALRAVRRRMHRPFARSSELRGVRRALQSGLCVRFRNVRLSFWAFRLLRSLRRSRIGSGSLRRLHDCLRPWRRVHCRRVRVRKWSNALRQRLRRHRVGPVELRRVRRAVPGRECLRRVALRVELPAGERRLLGLLRRHHDGSGQLRRLREGMRARIGLCERPMSLSVRADVVQRRLRRGLVGPEQLRRVRHGLRDRPILSVGEVRVYVGILELRFGVRRLLY